MLTVTLTTKQENIEPGMLIEIIDGGMGSHGAEGLRGIVLNDSVICSDWRGVFETQEHFLFLAIHDNGINEFWRINLNAHIKIITDL